MNVFLGDETVPSSKLIGKAIDSGGRVRCGRAWHFKHGWGECLESVWEMSQYSCTRLGDESWVWVVGVGGDVADL